MTIPEPQVVATIIQTAIKAKSDSTPRTQRSHAGIIGPSDVGFCRQKAVLMTLGTPQSDTKPSWAADVGTAVHWWVEDALATAFPGWLCGDRSVGRVTATLSNGVEITGTPDVVVPEWNAVLDIKTKAGLETAMRYGDTEAYRFQRWIYALALTQAGILDPTKPVYVGNVYLDRSGTEETPYVTLAEWDDETGASVVAWLDDVLYAVVHQEDASRDVAAPVCEKICEYFTVCRGQLPVAEQEFITDDETRQAIRMYVEGRDLAKKAKQMQEEAKATLSGINGSDGEWQVRWSFQGESEVPGYTRAPSMKIDVRRARK